MRILLLAHNVAWQGSALRAFSLARRLVADGHDATLVAGRAAIGITPRSTTVDGVELVEPADLLPRRVRNAGLSPLDLVHRLVSTPRRRPDVVHAFEPRPTATLPALLVRRLTGAPVVVDWADLWGPEGMGALLPPPGRATLGRFDALLEPRTRRAADAVTVISSDLRDRALRLGIHPDRVLLLPVGANDDLFRPGDASTARTRLGLRADRPVVLHSGFAPFDDELLVATWHRVARDRPDAVLLTTGRRIHGLEPFAATGGVVQRGLLPYPALQDAMAAADLVLVPYSPTPTNVARSPNRIGDYLAAGRPFVTNPTGDLGRLVGEEGVGVLADPRPEDMAAAVVRLLDDAGRRAEMGARARALAEGSWSWGDRARALEVLYAGLVGAPARSMSIS